jgi:hypothetical protein
MNDEPDLELEAASAAVDGLATVDERALVESSQTLQADVERFAGVRASVADVQVPPGAREAALAAALAAFDELGRADSTSPADGAPDARPVPAVVTLPSRRRRQYRALVGVAAAVVVLGVGAVAVTNRGADDVNTAETATTLAGVDPRSPAASRENAPAGTDPADAAGESATGGDEATSADDDSRTQLPAPAAESPEPLIINDPAQVIPSIESPEELLAYAAAPPFGPAADSGPADIPAPDTRARDTEAADATSDAAGATTADTAAVPSAPDPATGCVTDDTEYVGPVLYQGRSSHVVRVVVTGEVRALDSGDCRVLATGAP